MGRRYGSSMDPQGRADTMTSLDLLRQAREGDGRALERLLTRYVPRLRKWTRGRLPGWAREMVDTDDIVQEALIGTFRNLDRFEPEHDGALLAYMRRALQNRIQDELRKAHRRPPRDELPVDAAAETVSPIDGAMGKQAQERYEQALLQLDETERQLIICRVEMGLSYAEVAQAVCKPSADAARMAVSRALVRLARTMNDG